MTHTIFIHEAQLVSGIPNETESELITYKYKIPTKIQIYDMTTNFLLLYEL